MGNPNQILIEFSKNLEDYANLARDLANLGFLLNDTETAKPLVIKALQQIAIIFPSPELFKNLVNTELTGRNFATRLQNLEHPPNIQLGQEAEPLWWSIFEEFGCVCSTKSIGWEPLNENLLELTILLLALYTELDELQSKAGGDGFNNPV